MRALILAMTAMTVAVVHAQSKPPTSMPPDVGPGRVARLDITTTDLSKPLVTDPAGHPIGLYSRTSLASQQPRDVAAAVQSPQLTATNQGRERRDQPVTADDVRILQKADELLGSESAWNRQDDRECADDERTGKRSLFCALHKACVDVLGDYDHRRVALQEVRFAVEDVTRGQEFQHRLRDFNNLPTTRLADVKSVLQVAMTRVKSRLKNE
jgi:hypothetical protein